jgi:hypothetical protein
LKVGWKGGRGRREGGLRTPVIIVATLKLAVNERCLCIGNCDAIAECVDLGEMDIDKYSFIIRWQNISPIKLGKYKKYKCNNKIKNIRI